MADTAIQSSHNGYSLWMPASAGMTMYPQAGRKVFTLQTLPASDEAFDAWVGQAPGLYPLHIGRSLVLRPVFWLRQPTALTGSFAGFSAAGS